MLFSLSFVPILRSLIIKLLSMYFVIFLELVLLVVPILAFLVLCLLWVLLILDMVTVGILGIHGKVIVSYQVPVLFPGVLQSSIPSQRLQQKRGTWRYL